MSTENERLLKASIEILQLQDTVVAQGQTIALQEARIRVLECKLQRARKPFDLNEPLPALLRRQAE